MAPEVQTRPAARLVVVCALAALACGCTRVADSTVPKGGGVVPPRQGGSFHVMIEPPGTYDPALVDDVYESCVVNQLFDGLLEFDVHLNPVPAIAREWSVSRDGLEYSFRLRSDIRFHNGRRVVAQDVVYSFTRIFGPNKTDFGIGGAYLRKIDGVEDFIAGRATSIRGLVAASDTTLLVRLEAPYGSFLSALAMDQAKIVAREEMERPAAERRPVGTGPFVWQQAVDDPADPRIVLRANEAFRTGRAHLDEVVFHVSRDYNVDLAAQALVDGRVSMCEMPGSWRERLENDPRFRIVQRPELSFSFIGFHVGRPPLDDVRVRRAIAHAIDRRRIAAIDAHGRIVAVGILPPGMFGYSPEDKVPAYDPEEAKALLAAAGHPGGEGIPPIPYYQAKRGEAGMRADAILRENLAAVGLSVDFRYPDWDQFSADIDGARLPALALTWVADVPDPDSFLASLFLSDGAYNMFGYSNPQVDALLTEGSRMRGSHERADVYRRAEQLILDDVPILPLFNVESTFVLRTEVRDLLITPFGLGNLFMERIWLETPSS